MVYKKDFQIQSYLKYEDITLNIKGRIFNYRMRMLPFGENYQGPRTSVPCPFGCPLVLAFFVRLAVHNNKTPSINHEDFLQGNIEGNKIYELEKLMKQREKLLEIHNPNFKIFL